MKGQINILMLAIAMVLVASCKEDTGSNAATSATDGVAKKVYPTTGSIEFLDDELKTLIDEDAKIEILAGGFNWSEGPLWLEEAQTLIFSDVPENKIYSWSEEDSIQIYLNPSGYTGDVERGGEMGSNGLTIGPGGQLVIAQHGNRAIGMMTVPINEPASEFMSIASTFKGQKLNSPNDVIFSNDGTMFFTDPPYGLANGFDDPFREIDFNGVYRKTPNNDVFLIDDELTRPNGIAFSIDETKLYVSSSDPDKAIWMEYTLGFNLNVMSKKVFADMTDKVGALKGLPDGMKVKSSGHLFASGPGGILIFAPDGRHLGTIMTDENTSNCAFDTDENYLYMTADDYLMRIALKPQNVEM